MAMARELDERYTCLVRRGLSINMLTLESFITFIGDCVCVCCVYCVVFIIKLNFSVREKIVFGRMG
jgi:hypothetical protein